MPAKKIKKLSASRTKLIDRIIEAMEKRVQSAEADLLRSVVDDFIDKLDITEGNVANTLRNKRLLSTIDNVFKKFANDKGLATVKGVVDGVAQVVDFNKRYFGNFLQPTKLGTINGYVTESVNAWLGIGPKGGIEKNGYLDTVIKDATIRNKVKDITIGAIVGQKGYRELKSQISGYIAGDAKNEGALKKYYRNFVYDTFSVADRTAAKIFADKLKFNYAIYEGGLIKTSRQFCRDRNGKVFSRDEIADFDPETAKQPGYNPFTDLGGYACRHHLNWIPDAIAFALRPDLRTKKLTE